MSRLDESGADGRARARVPDADGPETTADALARARRHGRAAAAETLAMLRALLDAASLATRGEGAEAHVVLGPVAALLDGLAGDLADGGEAASTALLEAVADALDAEIARWETRAHEDPEARSVLRAFLGLRELLWEFGVRRPPGPSPEEPRRAPPRKRPRRRSARVQRVPVEG